MGKTDIPWADVVWNPITGCSRISPGCDHCYAQRFAKRLAGRHGYDASEPFRPTFHEDRLEEPSSWKKPRRVFANSMGDWGHPDVKLEWIQRSLYTIEQCPDHTFMLLTKRVKELADKLESTSIGDLGGKYPLMNLWLGATVEGPDLRFRIEDLIWISAGLLFISAEPMLGPLDLRLGRWRQHTIPIGWVIAGPETGPGARPCDPAWMQDLADQCESAGVPFFDKRKQDWIRREFPKARS